MLFPLLTTVPFLLGRSLAATASIPIALVPADSQCLNLPGAHDSTTLIVNAILKSKDPNVALPDEYADRLEQIIAAQFQAPTITSFMVVTQGTAIDKDSVSAPAYNTRLYFYIRRDGSITEPLGIGMSLNHVWEYALMDALDTVAQHKLFPPLPKSIDQDSILTTYIVAGALPRPALAHVVLPPTTHPKPSQRRAMRLVSLTVLLFPNYTLPVLQKDHPFPVYSVAARRARLQDTVLTEFVVGSDGNPIPTTIDITNAHYQEFIAAVAAVIPQLHFTPAMMEGCAVNMHVRLPFLFMLR